MKLSLGVITARHNPQLNWFFESLRNQIHPGDVIQIIIIDLLRDQLPGRVDGFETGSNFWHHHRGVTVEHVLPMPSVFAGAHRLTNRDFWIVSASRNTGICLARHDWYCTCDDRCVLGPHYLEAIRDAMDNQYVVAGAYEKLHNLVVESGIAVSCVEPADPDGRPTGKDPRRRGSMLPRRIPGDQMLGCTSAYPLEWALTINGYSVECDSLGLEDVVFGQMMEKNSYPICYDERMILIEDRTPGGVSDVSTVRTDKGRGTMEDKGHAILRRASRLKRANPLLDLRAERERVLRGESWTVLQEPTKDFYDGQPLSELTVQ